MKKWKTENIRFYLHDIYREENNTFTLTHILSSIYCWDEIPNNFFLLFKWNYEIGKG